MQPHAATSTVPLLAGLSMSIVCAYFAALATEKREFVSWKDHDQYVLSNPTESAFGSFTQINNGLSESVSNAAKMMITIIMGRVEAGDFIKVALGLHSVNTTLAGYLAYIKLGSTSIINGFVAFLVSTLMALHPFRIEAVAWASSLSFVIATFFSLCACIAHSKDNLILGYTCCILAAGSNASAVLLPCLLLMYDVTKRGGTFSNALQMSSLLALGTQLVAFCLTWSSSNDDAIVGMSLEQQLLVAAWGFFFYIQKTVLPSIGEPFGIVYALRTGNQPLHCGILLVTSIIIILLLGVCGKLTTSSIYSQAAYGFAEYSIVIAPVLGFVQSGYLTMAADRFSYLTSFIVFVPLFTKAIVFSFFNVRGRCSIMKFVFGLGLLLSFSSGVMESSSSSERLISSWSSSAKLWQNALSTYEANAQAKTVFSWYLLKHGDALSMHGFHEEALVAIEQAIHISPDLAFAYNVYGSALYEAQKVKAAQNAFAKSMELDPYLPHPVAYLSMSYHKDSYDPFAVLSYYRFAYDLHRNYTAKKSKFKYEFPDVNWDTLTRRDPLKKPQFWLGYCLCASLVRTTNRSRCESSFCEQPKDLCIHGLSKDIEHDSSRRAELLYQLAKLELASNNQTGALSRYSEAIFENGSYVDAIFGKANLLQRLRRFESSISLYLKAIEIQPNMDDLRFNAALALKQVGELDTSLLHAKRALEINPDHAKAQKLVDMLYDMGAIDENN